MVRAGESAGDGWWPRVLSFVESHGGLSESRRQALAFAERARNRLLSYDDSPCRQSLLEAVDYAVQRDR
jgi:geranylgeranyl pyrophosphate synthase